MINQNTSAPPAPGAALTMPGHALELCGLIEHLDLCRDTNSRLFVVRCQADRLRDFVTTRFVTSLTMVVAVIGVVYLSV